MAGYVIMIKLEDNKEKVVYKFGRKETNMGIIEFNKITESFNIIEPLNDEYAPNNLYERWAKEKIAKILRYEDGVFPDVAEVAK